MVGDDLAVFPTINAKARDVPPRRKKSQHDMDEINRARGRLDSLAVFGLKPLVALIEL